MAVKTRHPTGSTRPKYDDRNVPHYELDRKTGRLGERPRVPHVPPKHERLRPVTPAAARAKAGASRLPSPGRAAHRVRTVVHAAIPASRVFRSYTPKAAQLPVSPATETWGGAVFLLAGSGFVLYLLLTGRLHAFGQAIIHAESPLKKSKAKAVKHHGKA